ncbi:MAG: hypothetical protein K6A98_05210 [Prevotella sp.]|jgi:hypothetical protein|nr:hypothetical protein [Prevotella sp.]MCR5152535.1 hypothetical protein [Prevotella sp.]
MKIAVDFDGTIVEHEYPKIGRELPFATDTLKMLIADQHQLILWSCREGQLLEDAIEWCRKRGVEFYAVNRDYPEEEKEKNNNFSRKLKVDMFIDDRNVGGLPDWGQIYHMIKDGTSFQDLMHEIHSAKKGINIQQKKKWWQFG